MFYIFHTHRPYSAMIAVVSFQCACSMNRYSNWCMPPFFCMLINELLFPQLVFGNALHSVFQSWTIFFLKAFVQIYHWVFQCTYFLHQCSIVCPSWLHLSLLRSRVSSLFSLYLTISSVITKHSLLIRDNCAWIKDLKAILHDYLLVQQSYLIHYLDVLPLEFINE